MTLSKHIASSLPAVTLIGLLVSCGQDSKTPAAPSGTPVATTATPLPPTPTPTALPAVTATPTATCSMSITDATFDPQLVICPVGTTTQTVRVVFDITAGNNIPITVNKVSSAGVNCRFSRGSCTWSEGSLSFSPSVVPTGTRVQIVAKQSFTCTSGTGTGGSLGELVFAALYVNTSCGAARELKLTNVLSLG